jgi:hypothetical protein
MFGDIEADNLAAVMGQYEHHEQELDWVCGMAVARSIFGTIRYPPISTSVAPLQDFIFQLLFLSS